MAPNIGDRVQGFVLLLIALPWSALVLTFDVVLLKGIIQQGMTLTYDMTQGTITENAVKRVDDGESVGYSLELRYTYNVDNLEYSSTKYKHFGEIKLKHYVENLSRKLPVGRQVPVFYSPNHPDNCVLFRGFDGGDLLFPLFMTPFNILMFWFWSRIRNAFRASVNPNWLQARTRNHDRQIRIRLSQFTFTEVFSTVLLVSSFVCVFLVAFSGLFEYTWFMLGVWCFVIGISAFSANRCDSSDKDLILNDDSSAIDLPAGNGGMDRLELSRNELVGLRIVTEAVDSEESPNRKKWIVLTDYRSIKDRSTNEAILYSTFKQEEATALATWLSQKLSLPSAMNGIAFDASS